MDPIDQDVWTAGVGGHEAHPELSAFKYSGASIGDALGKVDMLSRQLSLESKSLDTLQSLAKNQENMLASIPSVKPVREDKLQKSIGTLQDLDTGFTRCINSRNSTPVSTSRRAPAQPFRHPAMAL
ncbi:MAG: hypothetical protein R2778_12295 [Saprospiraceae bacterium]